MNVVVSNCVSDVFSKFKLVPNFKEVKKLLEDTGKIDVLVVHKYDESDFEAGVFISDFHKSGVEKFIYINSDPSTSIKMVISGVHGLSLEDEFYLDDEEELLALIMDLEEQNNEETSLSVPALDVVTDFIQGFARNEDRINTPLYLERVNSALNELSEYTREKEMQISAMGISATEVFERASSIIKNMDKSRKEIERKLEELEESQSAMSSRSTLGNNVQFFSPSKYVGNARVLVIREYSPCRYLTSFCLGYEHHVHYVLNKRVKLVFIVQKGAGIINKYGNFTTITQESAGLSSLYDSEIIVTNTPKKEVVKEIWSRPAEVIIFVDRLYGTNSIVSGRVVEVSAVSGASDIERYKVKAENCIFPVTEQEKQLFCIPTIKSFPREIDTRYATYEQMMSQGYNILDEKLKLV